VKVANVAVLRKLDLPDATTPDGLAVPFSFYDEFMRANGLYDRVNEMLAKRKFREDPDYQESQLASLREAIKKAPMPSWMMKELAAAQGRFPAGTSIRCRSSTNNEDLPNFSGAGLYDSRTQRPDEGHLAKCIKQVYSSTWNLRAFLARDFYRIDHLQTAMGLLLHPNYSDEMANGVAVSIDPVYDTPGAYYVNTQLGEDLVTNPDAASVPEALLVDETGTAAIISRSNLVKPPEMLLTKAQIKALRSSLAIIHDEFAKLYDIAPGDRFAMEIEFKITADRLLSIKQARPWVFN
jgi:phosphoenolpyruvate synthase/pyruvate phosphate dikinase